MVVYYGGIRARLLYWVSRACAGCMMVLRWYLVLEMGSTLGGFHFSFVLQESYFSP